MAADPQLEKLLEEHELARRKRDTRLPLIEEALAELPNAEVVVLEGYMGFGRTFMVTSTVREALVASAEEERRALDQAVEKARELLIEHRTLMAGLPA